MKIERLNNFSSISEGFVDAEDVIEAVVDWFDEHEDAKDYLQYGLIATLDHYGGLKEIARKLRMSTTILEKRIEDFEIEIWEALDIESEDEEW